MARTTNSNKRVKKPIYVSSEEKRRNQEIIDSIKTKFKKKTIKMEFTYRKGNSKQDYVSTGWFIDNDDAVSHGNSFLNELKKCSSDWKLISTNVLNDTTNVDDEDLMDENA